MLSTVQMQAPKFGILTIDQQKRIAAARSGGSLSKAEEVLYQSMEWMDRAWPSNGKNMSSPMKSEVSEKLTAALAEETGRFADLMGPIPDEAKTKIRQTLDNVVQLLKEAPFKATAEVVTALIKGYEQTMPTQSRRRY